MFTKNMRYINNILLHSLYIAYTMEIYASVPAHLL